MDHYLRKEFGRLMRQRRYELKMTQNQLADKADLSCTYLRDIEHGIHTPTWINWLKICELLEIDPNTFSKTVMQRN